jgi:hypothetical protein
MAAPYGWTVCKLLSSRMVREKSDYVGNGFLVYKRLTPANAENFAEDLAKFTHKTKKEAIAAGERGEMAYTHLKKNPDEIPEETTRWTKLAHHLRKEWA